ncbi:MAG: hypothetical protein HYR91_05035 [Flavobacteriia bacterium]|nr:hypothetical protein [Flavobacteriia bacterium]
MSQKKLFRQFLRKLLIQLSYVVVFYCTYACDHSNTNVIHFNFNSNVKLLGHKGSGPIGQFCNFHLIENSFAAIHNSFQKLDGCEIDIQMSADKTLWIIHDYEIKNVHDEALIISKLTDKQIVSLNKKLYNSQMITLIELSNLLKKYEYQSKTLVLDLKLLFSEFAPQLFSSRDDFLIYLSKCFNSFRKNNPGIQLVAEVGPLNDYSFLRKFSTFHTFLVINDNENIPSLEIQKKDNYSISIANKSLMKLNKNTVGVWTLNTFDEIKRLRNIQPQYIISDNIPLMEFIHKNRRKSLQQHLLTKNSQKINNINQIVEISELSLEKIQQNILLEISLEKYHYSSDVEIIISSVSQYNSVLMYANFNAKGHNFYFIDVLNLKKNKGESLKIYLINNKKKLISFNSSVLSAYY